jgi:NADPH-dependent stearoyl-CoA 9-desaturase
MLSARSHPDPSFAVELDALRKEVESQIGEEDLVRVRRLHRLSRGLEIAGRVLIHVSLGPVSFGLGVLTLWGHKQLQATEIGHPVLHGCYDGIEGAEQFRSSTWRWDIPIDEEAWHNGHNLRHHPYTNVAGRDPDIHFGPVRLTEHTPHTWFHYVQLPYTVFVMWPAFAMGMNTHFTGLLDVFRSGRRDVLPDRSWASVSTAARMAFRKFVPYYAKEYVFFPLIAGPMFAKVLLGNWLAETARDVYTAASIFTGHVGPDVAAYDTGTRARGRNAWYAMQVDATQNFEVPYLLSVLCGGLDHQIEHHLFPKLPPERLRQMAPRVREICERHGVPYRTGSWGSVLRTSLGEVWRLSFPQAVAA